MRLFVRLSLIGLVALVAIGFWLTQKAQPDVNAPQEGKQAKVEVLDSQCEDSGISLLVEFGSKASVPTVAKCLKNYIGTSWDIFAAAGLEVTGTQTYPVGFVCRIQNFPNQADEPCLDTPKANIGSWAYFVAQPGSDQWQYSTWGAATHKPSCGSAEAWLFKYPQDNLESPPISRAQTSDCTNK